jgi:DNA-binding NarL/FixJ family response regulator
MVREEVSCSMVQTRIVVAAARTLFRQGLVALIAARPEFAIVGEAAGADEARRLAVREQPDLFVLDSEIQQGDSASDVVAGLRASCPRVAIVVIGEADLTADSEAEADSALRSERARVLQQGAVAYLPARADSSELLRLLTAAAAAIGCNESGEGDAAETGPLPQMVHGSGRHKITEREQAIIAMVAQGMCNKEVAHRLGIGTQTVKNHVSHLLEKLALADRTQLAVYAVEHNFEF